jgi:hypothetical protein
VGVDAKLSPMMTRKSELGTVAQLLNSRFPTCVMQVNYPIHKGQPNPRHGKFFFVGSIPAGCYDFERNGSKFYDSEAEAIAAADAAGAERIQGVDCRFVKGGR